MSELSRDDVVSVTGPIDDPVAAEIIATGISKDELVAANARATQDRAAHNPGGSLTPGPFAQVVEILERLGARGRILGEAGSTLA
jgi:hypothetical protein